MGPGKPGEYGLHKTAPADIQNLVRLIQDLDSKLSAPKVADRAPDVSPPLEDTLRLARMVKRWRTSFGIAATFLMAMTVGGSNMWSYMKGIASQEAARIMSQELSKQLDERVDPMVSRIDELERTPVVDTKDLEAKIDSLQRLVVIQGLWMNEVVEALQTRKKPPQKPQTLVEAERLFGSDL